MRESVPLLIGLMAPSGGGKTFSSLRLATGIQQVTGGDIYVIDTEARRALNYADSFKFKHLDFKAPFGPLDYLAAVEHCYNKGGRVIIVDSMSHEHEGPGGVLEMHDTELKRLGGGDKMNMLAWQKPKSERRRFINTILQMTANFVFCFRAKEKLKMTPGKQPEQLGFMPIAGEEFVFEMTANCLLLPNSGGVPCWKSDYSGESAMMKLPEQFKKVLTADKEPLSESVGVQLAQWARGGVAKPKVATTTDQSLLDLAALEDMAASKIVEGNAALVAWGQTLSIEAKKLIGKNRWAEWLAKSV